MWRHKILILAKGAFATTLFNTNYNEFSMITDISIIVWLLIYSKFTLTTSEKKLGIEWNPINTLINAATY